jgi:hypothetical protein
VNRVLTCFIATYAGIITSGSSSTPCRSTFILQRNAPLPIEDLVVFESAVSVPGLSPDYCRRGTTRPVSYYALFKWWLLLSQHPGC